MNPDRDARAAAAFDRAMELEGPERDAWVASLGDLRGDVEALLASLREIDDGFLAVPAAGRFAADDALPRPGDVVGRYRIESVAGTGGSGTVFRARQDAPDRLVAVKVLRDTLAAPDAAARFRREAELLARLSHPEIAHVYDAGMHAGRPFLAMELVDGALPVTAFADARGLSAADRVRIVVRLCGALQHAHQRGIVHRDVKPANVLVDAEGRLRLVDFGIASAGADGAGTAGTPAWMSPEQASGGVADARSDVWGAGAVLHHLLLGRPPVDVAGADVSTALARAAAANVGPTGLDPDLDAVVRRALARDADARYASAGELGDDLRRWLDRVPVRARPASARHAFALFLRRRPGLAAAIGGLGFALAAGTVVSVLFALDARRERIAAETARDRAVRQAYVADVVAAAAAIEFRDISTARLALTRAPASERGFEWRHLFARLDESASRYAASDETAFAAGSLGSPTTLSVLTNRPGPRGMVRTIELRDGATHAVEIPGLEHVTAMGVGSDGRTTWVGRRDGSIVGVSDSGSTVREGVHDGPVNAIASHPGSGLAASGGWDGRVRVWSEATGEVVRTIVAHDDRVVGLRYSPSGAVLATAGRDGLVRFFDAATGARLREFAGHEGSVEDIAWSPDGRRFATVSRDATLRVWDVEGGAPPRIRAGHLDNVRAVAWSPDGSRIATASYDRTVGLWDASDLGLLRRFVGHESPVRGVGFAGAPDRVWSVALDGVREWLEDRRPAVASILPSKDRLTLILRVSPDGREALLAGNAGDVTLADLATGAERWTIRMDTGVATGAAFLADGSIATVWSAGPVVFLDRATGASVRRTQLGMWVIGADFATETDGAARTTLAATDGDCVVRVDPWTGRELSEVSRRGELPRAKLGVVDVDARSGRILCGDSNGLVRLLSSGAPPVTIRASGTVVTAVRFSDDGRLAAWASDDGVVAIWDVARGEHVFTVHPHSLRIRALAFSHDGRRLATGSEDMTIRLLDAETGADVLVQRMGWAIAGAEFTPGDDALVVAGCSVVDAPAIRILRTTR